MLPIFLLGCTPNKKERIENTVTPYQIRYARGFEVKKYDGYTHVAIRNPWDTARLLQQYVLVNRDNDLPKELPEGIVVRTPVESIVAYASPHCGVLDELNRIGNIKGVCESRFIDIPYIQKGVAAGTIIDLGEASAPDVEKIIELQPEIIMTSPFQNISYGRVSKTGIPIIECADYMEATPLARAEWIRFHSLFYEVEHLADSLFGITEANYLTLRKKVKDITNRPTMFAEKKNGASWFVPGGNSYMANFYKDAGANYIWSDTPSAGSMPMAFEEVFDKAASADIWLLKHNSTQELTYDKLKEEHRLYSEFGAFKNKNIFVCNSGRVPFYEEMPLHPDRLLEDLIWIFHPELMTGYTPRYFHKMEN